MQIMHLVFYYTNAIITDNVLFRNRLGLLTTPLHMKGCTPTIESEIDNLQIPKGQSTYTQIYNQSTYSGYIICVTRTRILGVYPANTKHLYNIYTTSAQRLRRWSNIVYMLYKCSVFTGSLCDQIRYSGCRPITDVIFR